jgi:ketosteroid isomerase-like protein
MHTPSDIARRFVEAVNARSIGVLAGLLSEDHVFLDSADTRVIGRDANRQAWIAYFVMIPDYRISVDRVMESGDTVAMFGSAEGTFAPDGKIRDSHRWQIPAAWRIRVVNDRIAELQVYADNEPVRVLMNAAG